MKVGFWSQWGICEEKFAQRKAGMQEGKREGWRNEERIRIRITIISVHLVYRLHSIFPSHTPNPPLTCAAAAAAAAAEWCG